MSGQGILIATLLSAILVVALALLAGSFALLLASHETGPQEGGSLKQAMRQLDRQWRVERVVYRHHRIFGLTVVVTALICSWQLLRPEAIPGGALGGGWALAGELLLAGQGFNLIVGSLIVIRPSLLKPLEAAGNRWRRIKPGDADLPAKARALVLLLVAALVAASSALLLFRLLAG